MVARPAAGQGGGLATEGETMGEPGGQSMGRVSGADKAALSQA